MAYGVNAAGHRVQTADSQAMVNCVFSDTQIDQLPPRDHPMLCIRQPSHSGIGSFLSQRSRPSTSQPAFIAG